MTHLFNRLQFPGYSRITGIWTNQAWTGRTDSDVAVGHLIRLPWDQDPSLEGSFLCSHLPFHVGGFSGLYPDGSPWLFILQVAPADASALVGEDDTLWTLRDGLSRALRFNHEAGVVDELAWDRDGLGFAYAEAGVGEAEIADWSVSDLMRGLLTECCYVELFDVVDGYSDGCAFPGIEHDCTGDVFTDVFARWAQGLLATPDPDPDLQDGGDDDLELVVSRELLDSFSDKEVRFVARELGIPTRRRKSKKKRSRRRLIDLILAEFDDAD
jgi:hypothetical protein